jgi:hypothetical protein
MTMRKIFMLTMCASLLLMFVQCKGKKGAPGSEASNGDSTGTAEKYAVCIWDRASMKDAPDEKGKWLTSINLGEKCTYLDDSKEVTTGNKTVTYYKIKLQDGKEGWAQSDFVILESRPAVFVQTTDLYSRPDLLTKSSNTFSKMDIVAVKSTQSGFVEVKGKRKGGKWIESGWVKEANLSFEDVDIAVAKFAGKALEITDKAKRAEAINTIIGNADFKGSVFINELNGTLSSDLEMKETSIDTSTVRGQ